MAIATPSAKSHERVTGRWVRDLDVGTPREWLVYYIKLAIGTPVPWLIWAFVCLAFISRAGLEIAAWGSAILTLGYIIADRFSSSREFHFFRVGSDVFLIGYFLVAVLSASFAPTTAESIATLGGARWVLLLYLLTYAWELFPGLHRVYSLLLFSACVACAYGIWQHFTGVDIIRGTDLAAVPIPGMVFFTPTSFFNTPEMFGTLLAMVIPIPAAAYLTADRRDPRWQRYLALAVCLLLCLGVLWTYRSGIWMAAFIGVLITILMQGRHSIGLILAIIAFIVGVMFVSYGSPDVMLDAVETAEVARSDRQREQINTQVSLWEESIWIGTGRKALDAANYDPSTGNVYFQVLAQAGIIGAGCYFLFVLGFLLSTYRIYQEIPSTHYWHRVMISGALASQMAFHVAGLFWSTLTESMALNLFVMIVATVSYIIEHYSRGLVPDDQSL